MGVIGGRSNRLDSEQRAIRQCSQHVRIVVVCKHQRWTSIAKHPFETRRRVREIERNIGRTNLQDTENRREHFAGARHRNPNQRAVIDAACR